MTSHDKSREFQQSKTIMIEPPWESLAASYELGEILSTDRVGGTRSHGQLIATSTGKYFVRLRHPKYCAPEWIDFDHSAIAFLHERGVPVVEPRPTRDGRSYCQIDQNTWEVFPAIEHRAFRGGDIADVRHLGAALTQFHFQGKQFDRRYNKLGPRGETSPEELLAIANTIKKENPNCAGIVRRYEEWLTKAAKALSDADYAALPHTLVHGDVQPANVLMKDGGVAAFVDMDWCAWRPRVYDVAFAIFLCCSKHVVPAGGEDIWSLTQTPDVQPDCVDQLIQACADNGWALTEMEMRALLPQVVLSWCHCRLAGAMKVQPARREEFLSRPPDDLSSILPGRIA